MPRRIDAIDATICLANPLNIMPISHSGPVVRSKVPEYPDCRTAVQVSLAFWRAAQKAPFERLAQKNLALLAIFLIGRIIILGRLRTKTSMQF